MINRKSIHKFARATSGGTMIGYGLITALIAVSALGATQLVGERLDTVYDDIGATINGGSPNRPAPPTLPTISVSNASSGEDSTITFVVSLSEAASDTVSVSYATANGTAEEWADYMSAGGTLIFNPGQTSASIDVTTLDDSDPEGDETFTLTLSSPTNAAIADGTATGTIIDDDALPALSISDASAGEASGSMTFTASLSGPSASTVTVSYATSSGTAADWSDYMSAGGTLTFDPGETTATFTVDVLDDSDYEGDETVIATLSGPTNATISNATATGTIIEDDPAPTLSVSDVSVSESASDMTFVVNLSEPAAVTVTVSYSTSNGTAGDWEDYMSVSGTLIFNPGETSASVDVMMLDDGEYEGDETIFLTLSSPINATITDGTAVGTILEDDPA